ncbi:acetyl-CoA decarbonylase/synthase complex subunit gamma [Candidatus Bathyarchaeota archaeon]|nr:MAG: acetyl-CoA decarbonylase/synthase complex subunit gamma [Candidatus Bathyarchaeota archaeon]
MPAKELSPIDVYKLLPRTNCKKCGEPNCMSFAAKLVAREATLQQCPVLLEEKYRPQFEKLWDLLKPPVRGVEVGVGDRKVVIGGEYVVHRHEFTYFHPTAIAIDVSDEMEEGVLVERVERTSNFCYEYIGMKLYLDMIAVRSSSNDPRRFEWAVKKTAETTDLPLILCSLNPSVMEQGLAVVGERRPLIYAATRDNWREMADLALMYKCPLVVSAPNDVKLLRSLTTTLLKYGVEDLVLDPGTYADEGLADTLDNFTMLRLSAIREGDEALGFPLLGAPIVAWSRREEDPTLNEWKESYLASMLIVRYADLLIMHTLSGWALLPVVILRQNIYTDPRKPVSVEPGVRTFGEPDEWSPVMFTTNFALTYYTVASDVQSAKADAYLLVVDSEGISVESAIAGRKLTADTVAEAIRNFKVGDLVKHRLLIIPGRAARISGEIEDLTGWRVLVGPIDSSGIGKFLGTKWKEEISKIKGSGE